ncbi:MAG: diiron oxygenase [Cyanobacteria bacterium P01_G01_bin.39]
MHSATAIVCEVFIGGYLRSLAQAKDIQPLSQMTTQAHMMDELSHHAIFRELAKLTYSAMSNTEKEFFAQVLPYPVYWLVDNDLDQWDLLLQQINFKPGKSMIDDYRANSKSPLERADFSALIKLSKELGIDDINTRILECKV